ncbi:DUF397 domain-containing protein [Streptomyces sp. NPDC001665]
MSTDLKWFKSSYSGPEGGNCVEVALSWSKSSYSGEDSGNCVEVAACPHIIHVRDSKDITVQALALSPGAWDTFIRHTAA